MKTVTPCGSGTRVCHVSACEGPASTRGQALLEFAATVLMVVLPIVLAGVFSLNFGGWLYSWIAVDNAARAGANYAALGPASVGFGSASLPAAPSRANVASLIENDLSSLRTTNCQNPVISNSTDPEGYPAAYVTISCTYMPLIPGVGFPALGVTRQTVMRVLQ